jgi:L-fuconolactonase
MMHIDSHQHFWKYNAREYGWIDDSMKSLRRDFMPEDLEPELERNGFDGCVAVQARQTLEETRWLLELASRHSFIKGVVGWVDLTSPELRLQLESLCGNSKLAGIRHIVQSEPDDRFLMRFDFLRGIAMLEEFNLTYDILIYARHLPVTAEFVAGFVRQRFVLDHLAKPDIRGHELAMWSRGIRELAKFPNVYCKLSGLVTEADWDNWTEQDFIEYLDVAFLSFGAARLMIGSDWPVCTAAGNYSRVVDVVKNYLGKFPLEAREAVLGKTAREVYRIGTPKGCMDNSQG